jgi:hypothetical protein
MRIFPVYLFVSAALEFLMNPYILGFFHYQPFGSHQPYVHLVLYNLYTPFELFMFAWFLYQIIQSSLIKKLLSFLLVLFCLFFIVYSLRMDIGKNINSLAVVLESVIIIIPSLTWYRELFTRGEPVNLLREPAFWLVTGIFFYLATIIPCFAASAYLGSRGRPGILMTISTINNFTLDVTYILFIKGFTCSIKRNDYVIPEKAY